MRPFTRLVAALAITTVASHTNAAPIFITAADAGFVTPSGSTDKFDGTISPATGNYSVGLEVACPAGGLCSPPFEPMQRKNYFVFDDFSEVTADIAAASLLLYNPPTGYESDDPSETYVVGATDPGTIPSVVAKISDIGTVSGPDDVTPMLVDVAAMLFAELADSLGPLDPMDIAAPLPIDFALAEVEVFSTDVDTFVEVPFSPAGIMYLEEIIGMDSPLVLGGAVSTAMIPTDPTGDGALAPVPQSLFGFTDVTTPTPVLSITLVPEPATFSILTCAALYATTRRRNRT